MVPPTLLPMEEGGGGDPLDALVLGPAISKREVVYVRSVSLLPLRDEGEIDDKIIAV